MYENELNYYGCLGMKYNINWPTHFEDYTKTGLV